LFAFSIVVNFECKLASGAIFTKARPILTDGSLLARYAVIQGIMKIDITHIICNECIGWTKFALEIGQAFFICE
jgi:hypothetical protein